MAGLWRLMEYWHFLPKCLAAVFSHSTHCCAMASSGVVLQCLGFTGSKVVSQCERPNLVAALGFPCSVVEVSMFALLLTTAVPWELEEGFIQKACLAGVRASPWMVVVVSELWKSSSKEIVQVSSTTLVSYVWGWGRIGTIGQRPQSSMSKPAMRLGLARSTGFLIWLWSYISSLNARLIST